MTDTSSSYNEIQLNKLLQSFTMEQINSEKPSWSKAPDNAQCLGLKVIDGEDFGEWCWGFGKQLGVGFVFCEERPV